LLGLAHSLVLMLSPLCIGQFEVIADWKTLL
jgi:hypothetical protein